MPSQINLQITGRIQNIVFYKRGDKYYARSVPGRIRQTKATKKRGDRIWQSIQRRKNSAATTSSGDTVSGR